MNEPFCERCGIPFDWRHDIPCDARAELRTYREEFPRLLNALTGARELLYVAVRAGVDPELLPDFRPEDHHGIQAVDAAIARARAALDKSLSAPSTAMEELNPGETRDTLTSSTRSDDMSKKDEKIDTSTRASRGES